MEYIHIKIGENLSDDELRDRARKESNGEYVTRICRGCGTLRFAPHGDVKTSTIVDVCSHCFPANDDWMHDF